MLNEHDLDAVIREVMDWIDQGEDFVPSLNKVLNRYKLNSPESFSQVRTEMTKRSLWKRSEEDQAQYEAELKKLQEEELLEGAREHEAFHKHRTQDD